MKNLQLLLNHIGMDVCLTKYGNRDVGLFLTNTILCLKTGGMQAAINSTWVTNCQNRFLKQQIEIVRPAVVVALGAKAFHASLQCFGFDKIQLSDAIVDKTGIEIVDGVRLFAAYHCGAGTINRNRDMLQQKKDWTRIGKALGSQKS